MKKSMCCNKDMIYLGYSTKDILSFALDKVYNYCCSECGNLEWSSEKDKCKYKWYKYDTQKLRDLLKIRID